MRRVVPFLAAAWIILSAVHADAGLVARWSFDETEGTTAAETVSGFDGTLLGQAAFAPGEGIAGGAISLGATENDTVNAGDVLAFTGTESFAIQVWAKTTTSTGRILAGRHRAGIVAGWFLAINDTGDGPPNEPAGSMHLYQSDVPPMNSGDQDVDDGEWHQIVAVRQASNGQLRLYVDGLRVPTESSAGTVASINATTASFLIGGVFNGDNPGNAYLGLLDEVRVWDHALSDEDVLFFFEHPAELNDTLCGDATGNSVLNASDALFALRSAVGTSTCQVCICDANGNGAVTATDSLIILKKAVGQDVQTSCPVCVGGALDGLRWELPCTSPNSPTVCNCPNSFGNEVAMVGEPGVTYDVTLKFSGVVEQKSYTGGTADGMFLVGGTPNADAYNIYRLSISDPESVYYLNAGASFIERCWLVDYTKTIPIAAGATVTLTAEAIDSHEIVNRDGEGNPIIPPGVPPAPDAYNGQFIQIDTIDIAEQ